MSKVIKFYPKNAYENPDNVLEQAIGEYEDVFILGYNKDGLLDARASEGFKKKDILFAIETFKHKLLSGDYNE